MKTYLILHTIALVTGCIADLAIGDPHGIPHPIVAIGRLISALETQLIGAKKGKGQPSEEQDNNIDNKEKAAGKQENEKQKELIYGVLLCIIVLIITLTVTALVLISAYLIHPTLGVVTEAVLTCYILAAGSLYNESMEVYRALGITDTDKTSCSDTEAGSAAGSIRLSSARRALSMIVGRDTYSLDESGIIRACVETVAENTSDGVIAPLIYTAIGGPVLGMIYKAINTMDSMIGYRNERYEYLGRAAAKLDDAVNFIPSRLSALLIIASSYTAAYFGVHRMPGMITSSDNTYSGTRAYRIWRRDRRKHLSPNSAQTESACAGALGIRLGGGSYYGGVYVDKPCLGDDLRPAEAGDIKRSNTLMFVSEGLLLLMIICIMTVIIYMV